MSARRPNHSLYSVLFLRTASPLLQKPPGHGALANGRIEALVKGNSKNKKNPGIIETRTGPALSTAFGLLFPAISQILPRINCREALKNGPREPTTPSSNNPLKSYQDGLLQCKVYALQCKVYALVQGTQLPCGSPQGRRYPPSGAHRPSPEGREFFVGGLRFLGCRV